MSNWKWLIHFGAFMDCLQLLAGLATFCSVTNIVCTTAFLYDFFLESSPAVLLQTVSPLTSSCLLSVWDQAQLFLPFTLRRLMCVEDKD